MAHSGYLELLRSNRNYRNLWCGDIASLLGDWFNTIALYTVVQRLTGSPLALGLVFLTKMLPFALASPLAGLITDRFNRRRLMIGADLLRAVVVLGFLLVDEPHELPLLYLLAALQVMISSVFIPARSASIPNITSGRELLTANALSAATWSTLLAVGAALGGLFTQWLGVQASFIVDSASYLVSASFIWRTTIPQSTSTGSARTLRTVLADIADGWRHMVQQPSIGRIALTKASWSLGGGALVYMLALLGETLLPGASAVGIGLLYGARGIGTGIGPVAARAWLPDERRWPVMFGCGIMTSAVLYSIIAEQPPSYWLVALVVLAHVPSGANWVFSTVLLQHRTADHYRGRVFSTEWLLVTLVDTLSITAASLLLESGLTLTQGMHLFAGLQLVCGALWLLLVVPRERKAALVMDAGVAP